MRSVINFKARQGQAEGSEVISEFNLPTKTRISSVKKFEEEYTFNWGESEAIISTLRRLGADGIDSLFESIEDRFCVLFAVRLT